MSSFASRLSAVAGCVSLALAPGAAPAQDAATSPTKVIRFGIIGTDTSHAYQFSKILNNADDKNHVEGGRVVAAFKGGSADIKSSAERVDKFAQQIQDECGVEIVPTIAEVIEKSDVILLESVDGRVHLEQARPVFAAKKPVFIDKPLAGSLKDAVAIAKLAKESGTPFFSSSSLRYFEGVTSLVGNKEVGDITGVEAWSPCTLDPTHPDLYWYGIHGVEILYTLMGKGCDTVTRVSTPDFDVAGGKWKDGRIGTFRGLRKGKAGYGALAYGTNGVVASAPVKGDLYAALIKEIIQFAQTGKPPVPVEETIEIMAFMEAADESKRQGGKPVSIQEVLDAAGN